MSEPVVWVVNVLRLDTEFSGEGLCEFFGSFYLQVSRSRGFPVGYDADADSVLALVSGASGCD